MVHFSPPDIQNIVFVKGYPATMAQGWPDHAIRIDSSKEVMIVEATLNDAQYQTPLSGSLTFTIDPRLTLSNSDCEGPPCFSVVLSSIEECVRQLCHF